MIDVNLFYSAEFNVAPLSIASEVNQEESGSGDQSAQTTPLSKKPRLLTSGEDNSKGMHLINVVWFYYKDDSGFH